MRLDSGRDQHMTISQVIGRLKVKDSVAVNNIMGIMNKHVPGNTERSKQEYEVNNLWDALREIYENENGEHGDSEDEYDADFDVKNYNFYRR